MESIVNMAPILRILMGLGRACYKLSILVWVGGEGRTDISYNIEVGVGLL